MDMLATDVLVVGAGPAGLTMAALLAKHEVDALTVTKYPGTANSPRAHITNQRTMEVMRDIGCEDAVKAVATPNELMGNNVWATSFAAPEIARLSSWGSGPERRTDYLKASPCAMCNAPQHVLEPVLRQTAEKWGADIRFSCELIQLAQDDDGVTATMRHRETGELQTIRARYVVGADGGASTTVEQAGIPLDGETDLGASVNVWLEADLSRYTGYRPGTLYWMCQPGNDYWVGSGTWICVTPWTEWVMLFMYDPNEGEPDLSEAAVTERVYTTIGDRSVDVRIKSISQWQINHVVARRFRQGRVFIAGDAAHRHPPANGLGTNTSAQDSFNLAWKLAYVLQGKSDDSLLHSYNDERQPVGRQVVDRAMKSVEDMLPISHALGFKPGQTREEGQAALRSVFAAGEEGERRRAPLAEAIGLQNYQFNCHGVEMDQRYESSAVVTDGTAWPQPTRDPELYHHPTTHPGARLPHAWLERCGRRVSTLDLTGNGHLTLITGIGGEAWAKAAAQLNDTLDVPLTACTIGHGMDYLDPFGVWAGLREVRDNGCLLVRPDHHIAWRSNALPDDPASALAHAVRACIHLHK